LGYQTPETTVHKAGESINALIKLSSTLPTYLVRLKLLLKQPKKLCTQLLYAEAPRLTELDHHRVQRLAGANRDLIVTNGSQK
jgi:hypothetical protein